MRHKHVISSYLKMRYRNIVSYYLSKNCEKRSQLDRYIYNHGCIESNFSITRGRGLICRIIIWSKGFFRACMFGFYDLLTYSCYNLDFVLSKRHTLILSNTRELNRKLLIEIFTLYTELQ